MYVLGCRTVVEQKDTSVTLAICQILEPVDLKATITRNLASSWYHEAPVADVNCLLPTVKVLFKLSTLAAALCSCIYVCSCVYKQYVLNVVHS